MSVNLLTKNVSVSANKLLCIRTDVITQFFATWINHLFYLNILAPLSHVGT